MTIVKNTIFGASIGGGSLKCVEKKEPFQRCLPAHSKMGLLLNRGKNWWLSAHSQPHESQKNT